MKQVVKASIGRWAFTLEQPAYDFLDAYLTQIKAQGHDLDIIEENLGSYLSTQVNNVSQVVTMQQIQQAIQDLGLPAFETFSSDAEHQSADENGKNKIDDFTEEFSQRLQDKMTKHRLFRHPEQKVLGGVFGGLGAYFGWDPVVFRLLYGLFLIIFGLAESVIFPVLILLYLVLWVAMPLARNQQQLNQLYGAGAEKAAYYGHKGTQVVNEMAEEVKHSQLGHFLSEFFRITFGIIFFLVGMTGLVILPICFVWLLPADLLQVFNFMPVLPALGISKVLFYICLFIPFLIFFYEGIKLLFKLGFKKFRLGLLLSVFWLVSLIALSVSLVTNVGFVGRSGTEMTANYPIEQSQDTLYISVDESAFREEAYVCVIDQSLYFLWDNPNDKPTLYSMPGLKIHRDEDADEITVKTTFNSPFAKGNLDFLKNCRSLIEKEREGLKIYPRVYDKENPWTLHNCKMDIYVPAGMTVIMDYAEDRRDCVLRPGKRYFIFRGYSDDIYEDVDISTIDGQNISSLSFDF